MIRDFVGMMRGYEGQGMIPWNKQQFWFWLAAMLIVGGATTLLRENQPTQVVHRAQALDLNQPRIIRNRVELENVEELPLIENSTPTSAESLDDLEEQDNVIAEFHNQFDNVSRDRKKSGLQNQIQQTNFPQEVPTQTSALQRPSLIAPTMIQTAITEAPSKTKTKPIVWFSGSIEKISQ